MIARPARVDIRWRNPWRRALLRLFGWYVRFTHRLLDPGRPGAETDSGPSGATSNPRRARVYATKAGHQ